MPISRIGDHSILHASLSSNDYFAFQRENCSLKNANPFQLQTKEQKAAIQIQKNYRRYKARKQFILSIFIKYLFDVTPAAQLIQKTWRMYKAMRATKIYALLVSIQRSTREKAKIISHKFKGFDKLLN